MKRDQLNDTYLEFVEKQRLYFKTVKDFQEVQHRYSILMVIFCSVFFCLQCFDTVGWAAGRASGL